MPNRLARRQGRFWQIVPGRKKRSGFAPIVPEGDVRSLALAVVIAIMTFLASLTLGEVNLIQASAGNWQNQVSREATVQILPVEGQDMEKALGEAMTIVRSFGGVSDARIVSRAATERLLEPWLGTGFNMDELPVPRLITVMLQNGARPDFDGLRAALRQNIPGARLNDHHVWVDQLMSMAHGMVAISIVVFLLVLVTMILAIVFATHGVLSGKSHIVEVLHFIGADAGFVARQFDCYFFRTGLKGALIGGLGAIFLFFMVSIWLSYDLITPEVSQMAVLFGNFSKGWVNLAETVVLVIFVSILTMFTSRYAVIRQLREIDKREGDFFQPGRIGI